MKAGHTTESPEEGEPPPSLAPYANLLKFGFFNATTWMIGFGTPLVLLAGQLGATSFEVGIAYAFVFLLLPVQIIATLALPHLGYKKQVLIAWTGRGALILVPLYLAWLAPENPERWMVYALILSTFVMSFFRATGSCAVMPLFYATLPEKIRGKYFSTDQAVIGTSGIITLLLCTVLFRYLPIYDAFFWQYMYAVVGVFMTLYFLGRIKDPPKPAPTSLGEIGHETPRVCLQRSPFRQYLIFMVTSALMGTAFVPLKAYYLKVEAGLPVDRILIYTALQYVGAIIGTVIMRNRIDRIGVKPVFRISLIVNAAIALYWFFLVWGNTGLLHFLPLAYFLFGFAASQWISAHLKYMPRVCDESKQALHVSIHSAVIGIVGGIAPIIWGFLVKVPGTNPGIRPDRFGLYFLALMAAHLILFAYVPRLTSRHRKRPSLEARGTLLRPFRYVSNLVNIPPRETERRR